MAQKEMIRIRLKAYDHQVIGLEANANHFFCHVVCSSNFVRFVFCGPTAVRREFLIRRSVRIIPAHKKHRHRVRPVHFWRSDLR